MREMDKKKEVHLTDQSNAFLSGAPIVCVVSTQETSESHGQQTREYEQILVFLLV
tara:strand:+ start:952 stop:1116 length:165 start_codon:yes stop_codon:yes gene_type:complete